MRWALKPVRSSYSLDVGSQLECEASESYHPVNQKSVNMVPQAPEQITHCCLCDVHTFETTRVTVRLLMAVQFMHGDGSTARHTSSQRLLCLCWPKLELS